MSKKYVSRDGFSPVSGFHLYILKARIFVAPSGFGHVLPTVILEFLGSVSSTIILPSYN
jgi:hypothetical protein